MCSMKTRDLFAGCHAAIAPHDDVWLVPLVTDDGHMVTMQTYQELPDAFEAILEWALMLSDETEINSDAAATRDLILETLARLELGETVRPPESIDEVVQRDELRTWFEREMEDR